MSLFLFNDRCHGGRGRYILDSKPVFHESVKTRMESSLGYQPGPQCTPGNEIYVS